MPINVLFIGATGMLGKPVAKILVDQGFEVTAMVRDPEKAAKILPEDIGLLQGDLRDKKTLERAIVGHDVIYLNLSVNPSDVKGAFHTEKQGFDNLLHVLQHSGIKRVFYLSSLLQFYQTKWWVLQLKKEAVKKLIKSEIPATIFYSSTFMETLSQRLLIGNRIFLIGRPKYSMFWIAAEDYAVQVANAIKLGDQHAHNMEFTVQGVEGLNLFEAAQIFKKNRREKIDISVLPMKLMKVFCFLHPQLAYGVGLSEALNNYKEQFNATETWELLGKPEITLRGFTSQSNNSVLD